MNVQMNRLMGIKLLGKYERLRMKGKTAQSHYHECLQYCSEYNDLDGPMLLITTSAHVTVSHWLIIG